jgi:hypothetical protein
VLQVTSSEVVKFRSREEKRQLLDPGQGRTIGSEPHCLFHVFGGSEVERTSSRLQKL